MEFDLSKLQASHLLILAMAKYFLDWALKIFKGARAQDKPVVDRTYQASELADDLKLLSSNVSEISQVIVGIKIEQAQVKERLDNIRQDVNDLKGCVRSKA